MPSVSKPFLSVVVPSYNEPASLLAALDSLAGQQFPVDDAEIIVVDDGSSCSATEEQLREAAEPFRLQLHLHGTNKGRAAARNTGIKAAVGEVVVFLDSDMTVEKDFLGLHARFHRHRGPAAVCIGNIRFAENLDSTAVSRYVESRGVHRFAPGEVPYNCFVTGNSSIRRQLLLDVGLFDENFRMYGGEDLELGYRLRQADAAFYYDATPVSHHHELRSLAELCGLMRIYGAQSIPLILRKHPELARVLRLRFLERGRLSVKRWLGATALTPAVYLPVTLLVKCAPRRLMPAIFFDYLLWYHRTRAYRSHREGPR